LGNSTNGEADYAPDVSAELLRRAAGQSAHGRI